MPQLDPRPLARDPGATSLDILARRAAVRLDAAAINWRSIAASDGLRLDGESVENTRIRSSAEHAFLAEAAAASGDPLFLWHVGDIGVSEFGLAGYAALNAPTVGDALAIFANMLPAVRESATLHLTVDGDVASLVGVNAVAQPLGVIGLHVVLNLLRELIGPTFVPIRTGLPVTDIVDLNAVTKAVRAPVANDLPFSFVCFPARHLRAKVAGADARLSETLRPYWERQARGFDDQAVVRHSRLVGAVIQCLHQGVPSLDQIAEKLDVRCATLRAALAVVGGHRVFVDEVRRSLAEELVRRTDRSVASISVSLGFSEPAALSHAYRRWTGQAPGAHRRAEAAAKGVTSEVNGRGLPSAPARVGSLQNVPDC